MISHIGTPLHLKEFNLNDTWVTELIKHISVIFQLSWSLLLTHIHVVAIRITVLLCTIVSRCSPNWLYAPLLLWVKVEITMALCIIEIEIFHQENFTNSIVISIQSDIFRTVFKFVTNFLWGICCCFQV